MKPIFSLHLCVAAILGLVLLTSAPRAVHAQTTNDTSTATNTPLTSATVTNETHITSKTGRVDLLTRALIYSDNVRVVDPRIELTCEYMIAKFPTNGVRRVDTLVAETNVVALITTNDVTYRITAAKAVYVNRVEGTTTNQSLELIGFPPPVIRWASEDPTTAKTNIFTAKRIVWDLMSNQITADEQHGIFPDVANSPRRKKPEASATNTVSAPQTNTP